MKKRDKRIIYKILLLVLFGLMLAKSPFYASTTEPASPNSTADNMCISCHAAKNCDEDISPNSLEHSIHNTLVCINCHINPHAETNDLDLDMNNRCASCHANVCQTNVHSDSFSGGEGALCTDCHGIHNIKPVNDPGSSVYRTNIPKTCIRCHEEISSAYHYSFHGTAVELGSLKAATCVDCHGSHNILPPTNPASTVAQENIPTTCAKCHKSAEPNFAEGKEHITPYNRDTAFPLWVIWKIFIVIILIDVLKDCTIAIFELIKKLRKDDSDKKDDPKTWDI